MLRAIEGKGGWLRLDVLQPKAKRLLTLCSLLMIGALQQEVLGAHCMAAERRDVETGIRRRRG